MIVERYSGGNSAPGYVAWRRRRRHQPGYGPDGFGAAYDPTAPAVAGEQAALGGRSKLDAIFIGVTTGVSVWVVTRILDGLFKR